MIFGKIPLQQAVGALSQLEQPSSAEVTNKAEAAKKIEAAIKPLKKRIINGLLQHKDKDVRLLVAICVTEIFRILAPEPPFEDNYLRVKNFITFLMFRPQIIFSCVLIPSFTLKINHSACILYVVILSPSFSKCVYLVGNCLFYH